MVLAEDSVRSSRLEPYPLGRISLDEGTAEQAIQVLALPARQRPKRQFEDLADSLMPFAKGRLATWGESVPDRAPWSRNALDHSALEKTVGQCAEGLVSLERHLGEGVCGRVRAAGDRAKSVPLGERRTDLSQPAVHAPVVTVLELLDGSAQVRERNGHAAKDTSTI